MPKVLVTGFDPFNNESINPSYEAVKNLDDRILSWDIIKQEIPTEYDASINLLLELLEKEKPDIVILVGQAGGRAAISLERVAINIRDSELRDNKNKLSRNETIYQDGDDGYFSNLPLATMVEELKKEKIPAYISNTGGSYVCNNLLYGLLYYIRKNDKNIGGTFVHLPYLREQVLDRPRLASMALDEMTRALEIIIKTSIREAL